MLISSLSPSTVTQDVANDVGYLIRPVCIVLDCATIGIENHTRFILAIYRPERQRGILSSSQPQEGTGREMLKDSTMTNLPSLAFGFKSYAKETQALVISEARALSHAMSGMRLEKT